MDQRQPEHLRTSTTSVPLVGLALVFAIASFFVATSKAHSATAEPIVQPFGAEAVFACIAAAESQR